MQIAKIAPEALEITKAYLATQSIAETSELLGIEQEKVSYYLRKPEIRRFIDAQYLEQGFMNRSKIQDVMDNLFELKLEEMQESEMGTAKDILDLVALQHKMRMQEIAEQAKFEAPAKAPKQQINVNNNHFGENYGSLMSKLAAEAGD